jgi:hypothetical protein
METKGSKSLKKEVWPKKKSSILVGLIFVLTALAVIGYYWFSPNPTQPLKQQVRETAIKENGYLSPAEKRIREPHAKNRIGDQGLGDNAEIRQKALSLQGDRPLPAMSDHLDDKNVTPAKPSAKESFVEKEESKSERETVRGPGISEGPEAYPDEPDYSDAEPPVVVAVWFDPQQISPGAKLSIYIQATDNLSGVDSISGFVRSPSQTAVLPFAGLRSGSNGLFVGSLMIPEHAEMGPWYIISLRLTDRAHNGRHYSHDSPELRHAYFEIVASDSDKVPPEIMAVYADPSEVEGGGGVQITVEAEDDKSGVASIHGVLISPSKNARLSFACSKTDTNVFHGYVTIPEDAESGDWSFEYVRVEDEAKNAKTFYRRDYPDVFYDASIRIYTAGSDSQPPTLEDVIIYTPTVAYEESAEIIVHASDDISGISHISGRLRSPSGNAYIPFSCVYDPENQEYKAEVIIKSNTEVGLWRVDHIKMIDEANNQITYTDQEDLRLKQAVFEITGE